MNPERLQRAHKISARCLLLMARFLFLVRFRHGEDEIYRYTHDQHATHRKPEHVVEFATKHRVEHNGREVARSPADKRLRFDLFEYVL